MDTNKSVKALIVLTQDSGCLAMGQVIELVRSGLTRTIVYLKYVVDMDPVAGLHIKEEQFDRMREKAQQIVGQQAEELKKAGLEVGILPPHFGIAAEEILRVEEQIEPDVIVIVAPTSSTFKRLLMGRDFSEEVVRTARTPVLTVRPTSIYLSTRKAKPQPAQLSSALTK